MRNVIWDPQQVFPIQNEPAAKDAIAGDDIAKQIEVSEDTSFLLTESGRIFSWGKNDHGFLGREAKFDIKQMAYNDKRKKKLAFSNFVPGMVQKLKAYVVKKIKVIEGKFYAYFVEGIKSPEEELDSERDSEEEKDIMPDEDGGPQMGLMLQGKKFSTNSNIMEEQKLTPRVSKRKSKNEEYLVQQLSQVNQDGVQIARQNTISNSSMNESRMRHTNNSRLISQMGGGGGARNRLEKEQMKRQKALSDILKKAITVKDDLEKFDKHLADSVRPLTDIQDKDYKFLITDKFSLGQQKMNNADDLKSAIDRMQVQLKNNFKSLDKLQRKITDLSNYIHRETNKYKGEDDVFEDISILIDLLNESLTMKKFNLVGCKMKVYQERLREIK